MQPPCSVYILVFVSNTSDSMEEFPNVFLNVPYFLDLMPPAFIWNLKGWTQILFEAGV